MGGAVREDLLTSEDPFVTWDACKIHAFQTWPKRRRFEIVVHSLKGHYEEALRRNDVKAIVLTGNRGIFSGGLDLNFLRAIRENELEEIKVYFKCIRATTGIIEAAGKPLVAAIDGPALGGGLEISLACQARISIASARFALPELQLGLITAFGGTQRFPRLVGLTNALEMLLVDAFLSLHFQWFCPWLPSTETMQ